jgi:Tfp pilus assembly protein PilV
LIGLLFVLLFVAVCLGLALLNARARRRLDARERKAASETFKTISERHRAQPRRLDQLKANRQNVWSGNYPRAYR